ncbi:hypothetical protein [Thalassobius sp. I31.1]|uniref:hypothetical protein n=1 Tax=Thalassobius sp. I31.1 TaxID=2109912 RepID=UPI000D1B5FC5|nr:hypothetical protein [Thalassobius sp. I31.1]
MSWDVAILKYEGNGIELTDVSEETCQPFPEARSLMQQLSESIQWNSDSSGLLLETDSSLEFFLTEQSLHLTFRGANQLNRVLHFFQKLPGYHCYDVGSGTLIEDEVSSLAEKTKADTYLRKVMEQY